MCSPVAGGVSTGAVQFQMLIMSAAPKTRQILVTVDSCVRMTLLYYITYSIMSNISSALQDVYESKQIE